MCVCVWECVLPFLHQFLFGAFWANNVSFIGNETTSNQRCFAESTDEAIIMPMTIFEWDETSATNSWKLFKSIWLKLYSRNCNNSWLCNFINVQGKRFRKVLLTSYWFRACYTSLSKKFTKAIGTVWFIVTAGKTLSGQWSLTICASETFTMPWFILVCNSTSCDYLLWNKKCTWIKFNDVFMNLKYSKMFKAKTCSSSLLPDYIWYIW